MKEIYSLTPSEALKRFGGKNSAARAENIFHDLYRNMADGFENMTETSAAVRSELAREYRFIMPEPVKRTESGDSVKFLFRLFDGNMIETVLMHQKYGESICVSSQAGCNMGCAFCESGRHRRVRDLTVGELVTQVVYIAKNMRVRPANAAVMGIGEPLDNFDAVDMFCDIITCDSGMAIPPSRVTVSTCGLPDGILRFAKRARPCSLAISLHAADDALRTELMPINARYPLSEVIAAAESYIALTGRRVLIEYTLLDGVNDRTKDADELARLLKDGNYTVNLIEYNHIENGAFAKSKRFFEFYDELKKRGLRVTVRRKFGDGINAACGQLRSGVSDKGGVS